MVTQSHWKQSIIHRQFEYIAESHPGRIAISYGDGTKIKYQQLNQQVNQLAYLLQHLQIHKGDVVSVALPSGPELVQALLATLKAAGVYLPIDLNFAPKRLTQIFHRCEPKVLMTASPHVESVLALIQSLSLQVPYVVVLGEKPVVFSQRNDAYAEIPLPFLPNENLFLPSQPEEGNYIFYTSGSTGEAKAILGSHAGLAHFVQWEIQEFNITSTFRVSQLTAPTFDASLRDIFVPLCTGGCICIPKASQRQNISHLIHWLEEETVTLIHCVPSLFRLITKELKQRQEKHAIFQALKHVLLAGEMLYAKDLLQWQEVVGDHVELVNLYGPTETTMVKTFHRIQKIPDHPTDMIHVGKPISHTAIAIINGNHICRKGELGEIYIKTPYWTKGYYKNKLLTDTVFIQNPLVKDRQDLVYKTGDIGRYLPDGQIEIIGRKDQQLKINGIRVELEEIQQAVLALEEIAQVIIVPHMNEDHEIQILCYYTGVPISFEAFQKKLAATLPTYMIPHFFIHLEAFPLNFNGKIDKKALPRPSAIWHKDDFEAPQNETEQALEKIWKELLGLERIDRHTSFFKIGGTSLKAIQMISRIYKSHQVMIVIADIFNHPTIKQLAEHIAAAKQQHYQNIEPVALQPYYEVSHAQKRLWIVDQFKERQTAYNMPFLLKLQGELDPVLLQKALQMVVARHESLRTSFINVEGSPKQKISEAGQIDCTLNFTDITHQPQALDKIIDDNINTYLPLDRTPLFKAQLIKTHPQQYYFFFVIHHILSDAWSMNILAQEIIQLYLAFAENKPNPLLPLPIQYKDYTAWLQKQLSDSRLEKLRAFWLKQFEGDIPNLNVPTDFKRPLLQTFKGKKYYFEINEKLLEKIKKVSKQHDVTLFMTLLASVQVLLYQYSNQKDIVVGIPEAGRNHKMLEGQIGLYVNTIALRSKLDIHQSFASFLGYLKDTTLAAYEYSTYPFDLLIQDLKLGDDVSRSSLFDVMVQIQDTNLLQNQLLEINNLAIEEVPIDYQASKFDLTFNFDEDYDHLRGHIEFNVNIFKSERIEQMKEDLLRLLSLICENPSITLKALRQQNISKEEKFMVEKNSFMLNSDIDKEY